MQEVGAQSHLCLPGTGWGGGWSWCWGRAHNSAVEVRAPAQQVRRTRPGVPSSAPPPTLAMLVARRVPGTYRQCSSPLPEVAKTAWPLVLPSAQNRVQILTRLKWPWGPGVHRLSPRESSRGLRGRTPPGLRLRRLGLPSRALACVELAAHLSRARSRPLRSAPHVSPGVVFLNSTCTAGLSSESAPTRRTRAASSRAAPPRTSTSRRIPGHTATYCRAP